MKRPLEPEHPDILIVGASTPCGKLYRSQGKGEEAESLFKRALVIREQALGTEHPDVAWSLNNLGEFYRTHGRYAEAEPLFERALA